MHNTTAVAHLNPVTFKIILSERDLSFNGGVGLAMMLGNMNKVSDKPLFLCSSAMMAHMQRQVGRWWKD